jgi:hypothetical protein
MKSPQAIQKAVAGKVFIPIHITSSVIQYTKQKFFNKSTNPWNREADDQPRGQEISFLLWHSKIYYIA